MINGCKGYFNINIADNCIDVIDDYVVSYVIKILNIMTNILNNISGFINERLDYFIKKLRDIFT